MADLTSEAPRGFTGRRRQRQTRKSVKVINGVARVVITVGGLATIAAVATVCVFLVSVVVPLFLPPKLDPAVSFELADDSTGPRLRHLAAGEYLTMAWGFHDDGTLVLFRLDDGSVLSRQRPLGDASPTAFCFAGGDSAVAFGFADGTIRSGTIGFTTTFLDAAALPAQVLELKPGQYIAHEGGILQRTVEGQWRYQTLELKLQDPVTLQAGVAVRRIDLSLKATGPIIAALTDTGTLHLAEVSSRRNLMTGKVTVTLRGGKTTMELPAGGALPRWMLLAGLGDNVFAAWEDGRLIRYDTRDVSNLTVVERLDLTPEPEAQLTALGFQLGKTSLMSGDSLGRVRVWFRIKPDDAATADGATLVMGHDLPGRDSAVLSLAASTRTRTLAAGYADGWARLFHVTSNQELGQVRLSDRPVTALALSPKDDAMLVFGGAALGMWMIDAPHPETSLAAIFRPVWYEGYNRPEHVWQSSSGTDDFEPKYGLYPLVFGTLKATLYSMLFGAPLALLAAVYTSEMMHRRLRAKVKPTIELMASLPSVVLGFLAALVVAPLIEDVVPQVLTCFVTIPLCLLLGAYLWQLLPASRAARLGALRLPGMAVMIALGALVGFALGPSVERWLLAGDIKAWLTGRIGSPIAGWLLPLLPLSCLLIAFLSGRYVNPLIRRVGGEWSPLRVALVDLLKFLLCAAAALALALTLAYLVSGPMGLWRFDARGSFLDTYVQRNALVVGFIMGFAIIPIIYTISEDALGAVPEHLRSGSLGAGATPWQTATRIIIPTAMSGLFSALMIGLGRAVGETMIVLMAAGNTPVMEWNIFNGFRTLSANIAVELPEAVKDSTHFRMLFLAALTLFAITFVVNTAAESIRLRFRKRAYQL